VLEPKYAENIIVGVTHKGQWYWFISPTPIWILNFEKYQKAFVKRYGIQAKPHLPAVRGGIPIVDTDTANEFLKRIAEQEVTTQYLQNVVKSRIPLDRLASASDEAIRELLNESIELFPSLLVSFDRKVLRSGYPEMLLFEHYVPVGWDGFVGYLSYNVPSHHRYWWIDGKNYFRYFWGDN
jgi:hypothetical protein